MIVLNRSAAAISWKASVSVPWITLEPAAGTVAAQSPIVIKVSPAPPDKASAYHDAVLTIEEADGAARVAVPLAVHVIPAYTKPALPQGAAAPLDPELYKALFKSYRGASGNSVGAVEFDDKARQTFGLRGRTFARTLRGCAPYESTFNIEGKGFSAFSAEVGFPKNWAGVVGLSLEPGPDNTRFNYEIYVDGTLRTQSGFIGPKDDYRLLVVDGLRDAKELRLVVRPLVLPGNCSHVHWFDATFYK